MDTKEEQKRRKQFRDLIREMANAQDVFKNKNKLQKVYSELIYIYKGNGDNVDFRHYYSDIFSTLTDLRNNGTELDIVSQNLGLVYDYCLGKGDGSLCDCVRKFLDHTNLEVSRINYINEIEDRIDITGETFQNKIKDINVQVEEAANNVKDLKEKTNHSYSDFLSILGIFSGIVLVFFGGVSLFGNVISSMRETPIDKAMLICAFTGMVIFDIIFMFIYFLSKLLDRNISATIEWVEYQPIFVRFKKRYPIVYWANLLLSIISLGCLIYMGGIKVFSWNIGEYNVKDTIDKYILIVFKSLLTSYGDRFIVAIITIVINIVFVVAYIIAKITDINIGIRVTLIYQRWIDWEKEGEKYVVNIGKKKKEFKSVYEARHFVEHKRRCQACIVHICNFFIRAFLRYPYMTVINIIMMVIFFKIH